ncbi:MAG: universal stress protein [Reichenbachiella sp.]
MKNILVPIDFSDESLAALKTALKFAKFGGSKVLLLTVIEDPNVQSIKITGESSSNPMEAVYVKLLIEKTESKLESIIGSDDAKGVDITYKIDVGNTYSSIMEHVSIHHATLVLMGSKGASGIKEILVGSIADKITQHSNCPVIVVKNEADIASTNNILFATDLKDDQGPVLDSIKELQTLLRAHLYLLNVVGSKPTELSDAEAKMLKLVKDHELENYSLIVEQEKDIPEAVLDVANEKSVDLIAFGTHDRHGLLKLLRKRISKKITNHSERPIWTMPIKD